jgi:iron complex outermembrane receptor protein
MGLNSGGFSSRLRSWSLATAVLCILAVPDAARAADGMGAPQTVEDLRGLSIEDLATLKVTTVSRRPEMLSQAPDAVYVITAEDIRRAGATSLPQALRLAPNLEVAQVNAYSWTVTARGFNSPETANKVLVLINGRTVYEPIGGGVLWQQVDVGIENIDRIEVISGPGSSVWGANAVNGVVNVITRPVSRSRGLDLAVSAGGYEQAADMRVGGRLGEHAQFQFVADTFNYGRTQAALATDTSDDAFRGAHAALGVNGTWGDDVLSLAVTGYNNRIVDGGGRFWGEVVKGGWSRDMGRAGMLDLHTYFSRDDRRDPVLFESRDVFDIDGQQTLALDGQTLIWGGEYRLYHENFESFDAFYFAKPRTTISLGALYAQDELALRHDLKLTLGLKLENNSYSGFDWLPNVRIAWQPEANTLFWAAVSRAVRTPNRIERELQANGFLVPSPDFAAEKLMAYEAGWRAQPNRRLSLSLSLFYNRYDDLRTDSYDPVHVVPIILKNDGRGETSGMEGWAKYDVSPTWRLSAGFNLLHKSFNLVPGTNDLTQLGVQGQDPRSQAQLRSQWTIHSRYEIDLALRHVAKVDRAPVPAYTEADAHLGWRVTPKLTLALDGRNLLHDRHLEVWDPSTTPPRYIPRSVFASLRYGF